VKSVTNQFLTKDGDSCMIVVNMVLKCGCKASNNLDVWLKLRSSNVSWNLECEKRVFKREMFL